MKKNGFTLIELLAVIVILAIIALIATPIIINIIENAREESEKRSVELYASAVKNAMASYQLTHPNAPTSVEQLDIDYDGNVECTTTEIYEDGSFYLEGCTVNNGKNEYSYGTKSGADKACTLEDKDGDGVASLSDVVKCGTESFYVMYNENNEITMLSMYNLNVGDKKYPNEQTYGIQDKNVKGMIYNEELQLVSDYGGVEFSTMAYWVNEAYYDDPDNDRFYLQKYENTCAKDLFGYDCAFIYDENSNVWQYVNGENGYENYLKNVLKVSSAKASLVSYDQLYKVGCVVDSGCSPQYGAETVPEWVYSTSYWIGDNSTDNNGYLIYSYNPCSSGNGLVDNYNCLDDPTAGGVRPVISISTSDLR